MRFGFSRPSIDNLNSYLADKDYDKALEAVANELKKNPRRFNLLLRQAEILGLAGDRNKAISVYTSLAEKYARDGFYAKAIALYKKVLKLDANNDVHSELARLIEEDRRERLSLEDRLGPAIKTSKPKAVEEPALSPEPQPEPVLEATPEIEDNVEVEKSAETEAQELKELQASRLFAEFPEDALEEILSSTALRSYDEGDIIVTEGEKGSSLFLIVSGEVKVFTRGEKGEHIPLAELSAGDFFGEDALFTRKPRNASVTMHTQGKVMCLPTEDFLEFLTAVSATGGMSAPPPAGSSEGLKCEVVDVDKPGKLRVLLAALNADRRYLITGKHCGLRTLAVFLLRQRGIVAWSSDQ